MTWSVLLGGGADSDSLAGFRRRLGTLAGANDEGISDIFINQNGGGEPAPVLPMPRNPSVTASLKEGACGRAGMMNGRRLELSAR